jgi:hypothetical protein
MTFAMFCDNERLRKARSAERRAIPLVANHRSAVADVDVVVPITKPHPSQGRST